MSTESLTWNRVIIYAVALGVLVHVLSTQKEDSYVTSAYLSGGQKLKPDALPVTQKGKMFPGIPIDDGRADFTTKKQPIAPIPRAPTLKKPKVNGQPVNKPTVSKKPPAKPSSAPKKLKSAEFDPVSGYLVGPPNNFPMPEISDDNSRPVQPGLR